MLQFSTTAQQKHNTDTVELKNRILTPINELNNKNKKIKRQWLPAVLISYGFLSLGNDGLQELNTTTKLEVVEDHPTFASKIDNYLQYSPAIAVYGLNALGIKGKNNFRDRTIIYGLSTVISSAIVFPLKKITRIERPDGSNFNSFPSGHATTSFAAAEFLRQEYKDISPWYGIAGYATATATAILRVYNNKHWVSDIVAGAGFGILSTRLAYWIYPVLKRKIFKEQTVNTVVAPFLMNNGGGISLIYHFK